MNKKGVKLNVSKVGKDEAGFEDLDEFWENTDSNTTIRTSITNSRQSDVDSLNYDDTGSISDVDEEMDEEDTDEEAYQSTPAPRAAGGNVRRGVTNKRISIATTDSSLPFEDTPATMDSISPFQTTSSPLRSASTHGSTDRPREQATRIRPSNPAPSTGSNPPSASSSSRSRVKTQYEDETMDMDDNENGAGYDYGETNYDNYNEPESHSAKSSTTQPKSRRVSFGEGTKTVDRKAQKPSLGNLRTPESHNRSGSTSTTPESTSSTLSAATVRSARSMISTPGSNDFPRGRQLPDDSFANNEDDEDEIEDTDSEDDSGIDRSFIEKALKRKQYEDDDLSEEHDEGGVRRSSRVTKGQRLEHWKGERTVYESGRMIGILTANPTPKKKPKQVVRKHKPKSKRSEEEAEFDDEKGAVKENSKKSAPIRLPKGLSLIDRDVADELLVWDERSEGPHTVKVVCYHESLLPPSALPMTAIRPPGKDRVGYAAQYFNIPEVPGVMSGWLSGFVDLPAGAIKDAEGVGECAQVFFIADCQDDAVELGISDPNNTEWNDATAQRQLLKKGDSFFVPPGNIYRLENHSDVQSCTIHWCIVKPLVSQPEVEQMDMDV